MAFEFDSEVLTDAGGRAVTMAKDIDWVALSWKAFFIMLIGIAVFYIVKLATHRRIIKKYEKVKDGYILSSSRYALVVDATNNLQYLRPMFGKGRLPNYDGKFWQYTKGFPYIGANRIMTIIKPNPDTVYPILPPSDYSTESKGMIGDHSMLSWIYLDQFRLFLKRRNMANIMYMLGIVAPLIIIVGAIGFWAYAIYIKHDQVVIETAGIRASTELLVNYCKFMVNQTGVV